MALQNARLFENILNIKNYTESMIESLRNGLISLDAEGKIIRFNSAAKSILGRALTDLAGASTTDIFQNENAWVLSSIRKVMAEQTTDIALDTDLVLDDGNLVSVNMTIVPLLDIKKELIGTLLVLEDITSEKRLRGNIARYMPKEVTDQLIEGGDAVLGGRLQEVTVLFSDIRSFTSIAERIGPQESVALLNEFFSFTVDVIFRHDGILDKYIGDALLAVFGAPFSTGEDPDRAVTTAIEMMLALQQFNSDRLYRKKDPINIGIGISTNEVLSGNVGSMKRMDYTVIGDGVNLASRLENANKVYGSNILISEFTYRKLKKRYACREIDCIRVRGKTRPVSVYEVLDFHDSFSFPGRDEIIERFSQGLHKYRNRQWADGNACFQRILRIHPNDSVAKQYLNRCVYFEKNPPAADWDCIWEICTE